MLLGCLRLYCERFETDISHILELQFFFFTETTLLLSVRQWMCIRTSEQSLSHLCRKYDVFAMENIWKPADV